MLVLSLGLAGNLFAIGPVSVAAPGLLSFAIGHVLSLLGNDSCPVRICQDCRPNNEGNDDGNGDCRPQGN